MTDSLCTQQTTQHGNYPCSVVRVVLTLNNETSLTRQDVTSPALDLRRRTL